MLLQLPEQIKVVAKEGDKATFEISPLMPGYGATIANPLRRVLLSSLEGSAVISIKIKGVEHEFSTINGVLEDVIEIILNVKKLNFKLHSDEPIKILLEGSGVKKLTGKDIKLTSDIELMNEDQHIATLTDKKSSFSMELEIGKGVGYIPAEQRNKEKLPIGVIAIDAIYSPVKFVNFSIQNMRIGDKIDYNRIVMEVETDGSIEPEQAVKNASEILLNHFKTISEVSVPETKEIQENLIKTKPAKKKEMKTKKKE